MRVEGEVEEEEAEQELELEGAVLEGLSPVAGEVMRGQCHHLKSPSQ